MSYKFDKSLSHFGLSFGAYRDNFYIESTRFISIYSYDFYTDCLNRARLMQKPNYLLDCAMYLGLDSILLHAKINITESDILGAQTMLNGLSNFIFIVKNAKSNKLIEESFWENLILRAQKIGFNIVINDENISYGVAFCLAQKARKIIALRSGMLEFLIHCGAKMDCLYQPDCDETRLYMQYASLGHWKNDANLREFYIDEMPQNELIAVLLEDLAIN